MKLGILAPNFDLHSKASFSVVCESVRRKSWQMSSGYSPRLVTAV